MYLRIGIPSAIFALLFAVASPGQTATAAGVPVAVPPSTMLQPALSEVQGSTSALNISRWKAPGSVKEAAQQDVDSIQRDLGNTLPGLISQADAAPAAVSPSFALYRNLDALYDVLLRVSETANLAAPENEADSVATCLQRLESARSQLGDSILRNSQRDEAQMVALAAAVRAAKAAAKAVPDTRKPETIIDDGPAKAPAKRTTRKTTPKKPAQKPAVGTPASSQSQ
jgi:hypothetical protein